MTTPDHMPQPTALDAAAFASLLADPSVAAALSAAVATAARQQARRHEEATRTTLAAFLPVVVATVTGGTKDTYNTYWRMLIAEHGDLTLDQVVSSQLKALARKARATARVRRNSNGGVSAEENCVAALRAFFAVAVKDELLLVNPALLVEKPSRLPNGRRALTEQEFVELDALTRNGGRDPMLDTLLLRFHYETGARRIGAISLRLRDMDEHRLTVKILGKGGIRIEQPVSRTLFEALLVHAAARGAQDPDDSVFRYMPKKGTSLGAPLSKRRYNNLADRWQAQLPWAASCGLSPHFLRHTALTVVERASSFAVAKAFAGHSASAGEVTHTYTKATMREIATVVSRITGEPHPLAAPASDVDPGADE